MELIDVIKEPYLNKKSASPSTNKFVLTFLVDRRANKVMIKKAFHSFFGVKALAVNTITKHPKPARNTLKSRKNFTKARKVAYVSLLREDFLSLKRALEGDADLIEKELETMKGSSKVESQTEPKGVDVKVEKSKDSGEIEDIKEQEVTENQSNTEEPSDQPKEE